MTAYDCMYSLCLGGYIISYLNTWSMDTTFRFIVYFDCRCPPSTLLPVTSLEHGWISARLRYMFPIIFCLLLQGIVVSRVHCYWRQYLID